MLLIGGSGFLGLNWQNYNSSYEVIPTYNEHLPNLGSSWKRFSFNGLNSQELRSLILVIQPEVIVNCAAITKIEMCEDRKELSHIINVDLPKWLAIYSSQLKIKLVHISTDHFRSNLDLPRKESEPVFAVNHYGKTKLEAEELIFEQNSQALIVRVNFFGFGTKRSPTLLDNIINSANIGNKFVGFDNILFNPVSVIEVVKAIEKLLKIDATGVFNLASNEVISKYDFAMLACKIFNLKSDLIIRGNSSRLGGGCLRPNYMALDASKFTIITGMPLSPMFQMLSQLKSDRVWHQKIRSIDA
jgi:dTDP-4-dehydrorhamnose reductase